MDDSLLNTITKTSPARRDELFRWLANQGEATRQEAVKLQGDLAAQHRSLYNKAHRVAFFYAMQVLALAKMQWSETAQSQKKQLTGAEAEALTLRRIARIKTKHKYKPSPKKELIRLRFFYEIKRLKEEGLSWRQISDYIKTYHKVDIAFGYLKTAFEALEKERVEE